MENKKYYSSFIHAMEEREKELNCLYTIEELLNKSELPFSEISEGILNALSNGMQYPLQTKVRISIGKNTYSNPGFIETKWMYSCNIVMQEEIIGKLEVTYTSEFPKADVGPFLKEEIRLVKTIADRLGHYILHNRLKNLFLRKRNKSNETDENHKAEWFIILDLLRKTDQHLSAVIARKMLNQMFYKGITETVPMFKKLGSYVDEDALLTEVNRPTKKQVLDSTFILSNEIFELASKYMTEEQILSYIMKWINEEKSAFLFRVLSNKSSQMSDIADSLRRYYHVRWEMGERAKR